MLQPLATVPRLSWVIMAMVTTMVALSALWVALTPAGDQTELTDRSWDQFASQDPEVAYLISRELNILGALGVGFGLVAAIVAVIPYRRGERWAWFALWLYPIIIGAVATRMLVDLYPAGYYYAGLTAAGTAALLIPVRRFLRSNPISEG